MVSRRARLRVLIGALSALLMLTPVACAKSSSSSSAATQNTVTCEATGTTANGSHFRVPVVIGVLGVGAAPKVSVSLGSANITGKAGSLSLDRVSLYPASQSKAQVSAAAQNGRAVLAPFGQKGWQVSGSGVKVHVGIAVVTKNKAGAPDDKGSGECRDTPSIRRTIKKTFYCLRSGGRSTLERAIKIVIKFAEREGGWTYTLLEATNKDESGQGFDITIAGKQVRTGGSFSVTVQERVGPDGLGTGVLGRVKPFAVDEESGLLPAGSHLYVDGRTNANNMRKVASSNDVRCRVSPPILIGPDLFGSN